MRYRKIAASALAAAAVTTVVAVAGSPADATVIEKYQERKTPYSFTNEDCAGASYDVAGLFTGRFIGKEGTGPASETFPILDRHSFVETWTNTETGKWFSFSANRVFHEVKARPVDGTIFQFEAVQAGRTVLVDAGGELVASDSGAVRITFLFDTLGDGQPGGVYDFDSWVEDYRGAYGIGDLCTRAAELTS